MQCGITCLRSDLRNNVAVYIRSKTMSFVIAVYRSRDVSVRVYNKLISLGTTCALVSTPRAANVGCGLSVKMHTDVYYAYASALSQTETFVGFFLVRQTLNGQTVTRL